MNQADITRMEQLDRYLDDVVRGASPASGSSEFSSTMEHLSRIDTTPGPHPDFVEQLRRQLIANAGAAAPGRVRRIPRHWIRRVDLASAAALIVAMLVITLASIINAPTTDPPQQGLVDDPTQTTVAQPSPQPAESPTALPTDVAEVPTSPINPTPPVQLADIPEYESLEQLVNASDLVIVGRLTGEPVPGETGRHDVEIFVEDVLSGHTDTTTIEAGQLEYLQHDTDYLLFLSRDQWAERVRYNRLEDMGINSVIALDENWNILPSSWAGESFWLANAYAGRPVDELARDIAAIDPIEPQIIELLSHYGWIPIGKGMLRPVNIPMPDQFVEQQPAYYLPGSWEAALVASQRIGLSFEDLAGSRVQLLPYYLERRPVDSERSIWAILLIDEQQIIGAWVIVSSESETFGLDERDRVLQIPVEVPTPEPTPTWPVPDGDTVNPAQLYDLANTRYLMFCWPYCDETLESDELRDAIVQALDRELPVESVEVYPTPTPDRSLEPATGDYIAILFWRTAPFQDRSISFGYDRQSGRILLPFDGGWVPAPDELAAILDTVEIPPPPTKEKQP